MKTQGIKLTRFNNHIFPPASIILGALRPKIDPTASPRRENMVIEAQRGFTLIELLVVIAIISFLASIVMVSLDSARGKARNAKRNSDIIQLYATFQLGYDANGAYPSTDGAWACVSYACYGSWSPFVPIAAVDNFCLRI